MKSENLRYSDSDDRIYVMEDLYRLREMLAELDNQYQLMGKNSENSGSSFVAKRGEKPCVTVCNNFDEEINRPFQLLKK
ncbi:MAG: hypothetical protein GX213_14805 [Clostridiaceae bacterium]|nr:hypothetical protein [Clostridiaceae bacterium]